MRSSPPSKRSPNTHSIFPTPYILGQVSDTEKKVLALENFGPKCIQRGKYGDGGGEYAYFDANEQLKCFVETLESYPKKD